MQRFYVNLLFQILIFIALIIILIVIFTDFNRYSEEQNKILTKEAIQKSMLQCYTIEGAYPVDLTYLEKNYNLRINYDDYHVVYEYIASNIMPEIDVFTIQD